MKLIIVRHAETYHNDKGIIAGVTQAVLNEKGKKQAELLGKRLAKMKVDVIYCSDLKRCKQTIAPFLKLREVPIHYVKELRERNFGVFEGKPGIKHRKWADEKKAGDETRYMFLKPKGGESFFEVITRVRSFFDKVLKKHNGKTVLFVAHGGTKRALILSLMDRVKDFKYIKKIIKSNLNTSLTIININNGKAHRITRLASVKHLEDLK